MKNKLSNDNIYHISMIKYYKKQELYHKICEYGVYIIAILLVITILYTLEKEHKCSWEDCSHVGHITFSPTWNLPKDTTLAKVSRLTEELHFYNPTWTYEKCESTAYNNILNK